MRTIILFLAVTTLAHEPPRDAQTPAAGPDLLLREVRYTATLTETEARFGVGLDVESVARQESSLALFEGDVAVLPAKLPSGLRLARSGKVYRLIASRPGQFRFHLDVVAKITRADPWNQVSFSGPLAGIASITAEAGGPGAEVQLLTGTPVEPGSGAAGYVRGVLGGERVVSLRWQTQSAEAAHPALVGADTVATVAITPTVVEFTTRLHYEIIQGHVSQFSVTVPASQALTRVEGEQIRDWQARVEGDHQVLSVALIKPVEKTYDLKLFSEQTLDPMPATARLTLPQPHGVDHESGSWTVLAEDTAVEIQPAPSLDQVDAPAGALVAYRFYARPVDLNVKVRRIQPVINVASRVTARLEEARLAVSHSLTLDIERAGLYAIELGPLDGFTVADVRGDGIENWTARGGRLQVNFSSRVLGERALRVQLERPQASVPNRLTLAPLRVAGAARQTAVIGAASAPGIRLKTAELIGLREIPVTSLVNRTDELLAYAADQPDWSLELEAEKMAPRVVADVFNLVTIGDGLVGGSATIRYAIANQGLQEFRIELPAHWKNVEFTGPNLRRKERLAPAPRGADTNFDTWTIGLQDKAWGGYTLVVSYDEPFDPQQATLALGGIHALDTERETGSIAVTCAASLQLRESRVSGPLRRVDETDLAATDRALITRSVLLAYRYDTREPYQLEVGVKRFQQLPVLEAVADRTQLTTVLTEAGQMLTQASFLVKNNEKQFQRFTLPAGAEFWSASVDGQTVRAERQEAALLVPLPRRLDRDRAFAVDLVYAQNLGPLTSLQPRDLTLQGPRTDVQTTFAEWELYVPTSRHLARFGGNMKAAPGTTYGLRDAWAEFVGIYRDVFDTDGVPVIGGMIVLLAVLAAAAIRRGWQGAVVVAAAAVVVAVLAGMLLPALTKAKAKSSSISQLDLARRGAGEQTVTPPVQLSVSDAVRSVAAAQPVSPPAMNERLRTMTESAGVAGSDAALSVNGPVARAARLGTALVQGIRPLRIEIPRAGQRFVFTKVLNVGDDGLRIQAWTVAASAWRAVRSALQVMVFLAGLWLVWRQLRRPTPSSLLVALGLALVIGSVASLLLELRWLGMALVIAPPALALAALAYGLWRFARRSAEGPAGTTLADASHPSNPPPLPGIGPAAAAIALLLGAHAAKAIEPVQPDPNVRVVEPVSILSATYTGTVRQRVAEIQAVLDHVSAKPGQTIPLFGGDVAVESFTASPRDLMLVPHGSFVTVRLPNKGAATVTVKFLTKLGGDVTRRRLEFGIPAALSSRLTLTLDEAEAAVEFPSAVAYHLVDLARQTRVEAVLGAGDRVELHWAPRGKPAAEIPATVFCQNTSLVTFGGGVVRTRSQLDYQVTQGEVRETRVQLPAGAHLLRVTGEAIRTWRETTDSAGPVLTVELHKGMPPDYRMTVETEQGLDPGSGARAVATPHVLGIKRETGLIGLEASDDLGLTIETARGLQQVDAADFQKITGQTNVLVAAYRFLKPDFAIAVRVEALQPQIEATVGNRVRIGIDQITLAARVDYTVKRAGVFALRLALPEGFRVESVHGPDVAQWVEKPGQPGRTLEVTLKHRLLGSSMLEVQLVKPQQGLPRSLAIVGVQPLGAVKLTGFVVVAAEVGVQVRTVSFERLTEVPVTSVPDTDAGLAYKFIAQGPASTQPVWKLVVATEAIDPWVRAEIVDWLTVGDSLVSGRAVVRYEIQNAPVKQFGLRIPAAFKNVEINGANIRRRDQNGVAWRVELQNRVFGTYLLTVTWEQPWNVKEGAANLFDAGGVTATGVERETGELAVLARPELQVAPKAASSELIRIDPQELPEWAGTAGQPAVLAYRYLRPGYQLSLTAQRFAPAEVLQALADNVHLTTVVAEDGQTMSELALSIRNNGRQFLQIALPRGAQVWSAFVGGQAVRPSARAGKLLLPIEWNGDASVNVSLIYVSADRFPRGEGIVALESPALDVPLKNARWELYLPAGYRYSRFAGTMNHDTTATPVYTGFTLTEYSAAEDRDRGAQNREVVNSLDAVRRTLSAGKLEDASQAYSRARRFGLYGSEEAEKLKEVEKDLRKAQVGNLLSAQQNVALANAGYLGQSAGQATPQPAARYDVLSAERQWAKLQQAQEVAGAVVRPLRLNLPARGLRETFSQVLQTEPGVPMRIRFVAANRETTDWVARVGWAAAGFAGLWGLVSLGLRTRKANALAADRKQAEACGCP